MWRTMGAVGALLASTAAVSAQAPFSPVAKIVVPQTGATPVATPDGQQQLISGTKWINGQGVINGKNWRDNYQIIHDILNGMGTWDQNGNYTPNLPPVPSLGYVPLNPANNLSDVDDVVAARANLGITSTGSGGSGGTIYLTPTGSGAQLTGITPEQIGLIAGQTYLAPNGSGASLTGLTAAQFGLVPGSTYLTPSGSGAALTGITAAQVGAQAALGFTPINKIGDTMTGALRSTGFSTLTPSAIVDLYTAPPANISWMTSSATLSIASAGGHAPGDSLRAALYSKATSLVDYQTQETTTFFEMIANRGGTNSWVANKAYPAGTVLSYGGNTYSTTNGGTSSAANPPTNTSGTSTDGTITWTYLTNAINNGKETMTLSAVMNKPATGNGGVGNTWGQNTALIINSGAMPGVAGGFATLDEKDIANNDRDCPPAVAGACQTYGIFMEGLATPFTNTIGVHLGGTGNANFYYHWGLYIGPNFSKDIAIFENSNDPVGLQTGGTRTGAAISWYDTSTSNRAAVLAGIYNGSSIIDTSSAGGSATNALLITTNKNVTWSGGTLNSGLTYSSAVDAFAFNRNQVNLALLGPGGLSVLQGGLTVSNLPSGPPSGTKAANACIDSNGSLYKC